MRSIALLAFCLSTHIAAAQPARLSLEADAGASCFTVRDIDALLSARLGARAFDDQGEREVRLTIGAWGQGLAATVRLPGSTAERVLTVPGPDCVGLRDLVLTALAVYFSESALTRPTEPVPRSDGLVQIHVRSTQPELRLWRLTGAPGSMMRFGTALGLRPTDWQRICALPCDFEIAPGTHRLALTRSEIGVPIETPPLILDRDLNLLASVQGNGGWRALGWVLATLGPFLAAPILGALVGTAIGGTDGLLGGFTAAGILAACFIVPGIVLALQSDGVSLQPTRSEEW